MREERQGPGPRGAAGGRGETCWAGEAWGAEFPAPPQAPGTSPRGRGGEQLRSIGSLGLREAASTGLLSAWPLAGRRITLGLSFPVSVACVLSQSVMSDSW